MSTPLIYAKKMRLPSPRANVGQALNMALAFGLAGGAVRCFPGVAGSAGQGSRRDVLRRILKDIGAPELPRGWTVLPGSSKGLYGAAFRVAVALAAFSLPGAILYARDLSEADYLRLLATFLSLPLVYEAHEILHLMHKAEGVGRWQETMRLERAVFSAAAGLVCTTEQVAEQARESLGYAGPLLVAPNGYNPAIFHPLPLFTAEAPWPEAAEPFLVVYAGNFHPGKGVEELVEAFALLPDRFRLRIIGGSPEKTLELLRGKAESLGMRSRVEFAGSVPQKDMRAACAGAQLFVVPQQSRFFFSPLKLYEALALGLPVVVTPLPVFSSEIRAGCVHPSRDATPAGLARSIAELAGQPDQARSLRVQGLHEAAGRTWERRAASILEFAASLDKT